MAEITCSFCGKTQTGNAKIVALKELAARSLQENLGIAELRQPITLKTGEIAYIACDACAKKGDISL